MYDTRCSIKIKLILLLYIPILYFSKRKKAYIIAPSNVPKLPGAAGRNIETEDTNKIKTTSYNPKLILNALWTRYTSKI